MTGLEERIDALERLPRKIKQELKRFCLAIKESLGNELLGLILYGSALRDDYLPGHSDVNLLVLVRELDVSLLKKVAPLVERANAKALIEPLFLTPEYIKSSLDAFPVEYLNIKREHILLYGEDPFQELDIDLEDLRIQVEREWKLNYIRLQQAYFRSYRNGEALKRVIMKSFNSFSHLLSALFYLRGLLSVDKQELLQKVVREFLVREEIVNWLGSLREKGERMSKEEIERRFDEYLKMMERIMFSLESFRRE